MDRPATRSVAPFVSAIRRRGAATALPRNFPFTVPVIRALDELKFTSPVTFFVGENGSGKSTLVEGLAAILDAAAMGSSEIESDPTLAHVRAFANVFVAAKTARRPRASLFLRSEDVFGFSKRVAQELLVLEEQAKTYLCELETSEPARHFGLQLALNAINAQRGALIRRYGADPDARSHGETFLHFLRQRIVHAGLYVLDEPETPLSPTRVLALLAMLADSVATGSQFIIATHSPILMAYPGATIYEIAGDAVRTADYESLENVRVTRDFLKAPERYLRQLFLE